MHGINQDFVYAVTRIKVEFNTPSDGLKESVGTGFLLTLGDSKTGFFITNRHVLDPTYKTDRTGWSLSKVYIEVREYSTPPARIVASDTTSFLPLQNLDTIIFPDDESDVAIIVNPPMDPMPPNFALRVPGDISLLADKEFFKHRVQMMDFVSFIGFPEDLYDTSANLPIARLAGIASRPDRTFKNKYIQGELVLINGLSFRGSSGSPVFSHHKTFRVPGVTMEQPLNPKILGIVAGHIRLGEHTGLSYFVKSTVILALLQKKGFIP